jgi:hypothetical protein
MQSLNDLDSQPEGSTMAESTKSSFSRNYRFSKKGSSLALFAPPPTTGQCHILIPPTKPQTGPENYAEGKVNNVSFNFE